MQRKTALAFRCGILAVFVGFFLQWLNLYMTTHFAGQVQQDLSFLKILGIQAISSGLLTNLGNQLTYFGFAIIAIAVYVWLQAPPKEIQN